MHGVGNPWTKATRENQSLQAQHNRQVGRDQKAEFIQMWGAHTMWKEATAKRTDRSKQRNDDWGQGEFKPLEVVIGAQ